MKTILTVLCLFSAGILYSQSLYSNQFWNHTATLNPAMSGLLHKHHSAISLPTNLKKQKYLPKALNLESSFRIAGVHGVGVTFHSENDFNETNINYNYQFSLGESGVLSTGIGLGLCNYHEVIDMPMFHNSEYNYHWLNINLGVAYKIKNFSVGFSAQNAAIQGSRRNYLRSYDGRPLFLLHSAYKFQLGEKFTLSPQLLLVTTKKAPEEEVFAKLNVTAQYAEGINFGLSYSRTNHIGANIGYDVKKKFRFSYEIASNPKNLSIFEEKLQFTHELSIGYFLK